MSFWKFNVEDHKQRKNKSFYIVGRSQSRKGFVFGLRMGNHVGNSS